jgi:hypothetical protein
MKVLIAAIWFKKSNLTLLNKIVIRGAFIPNEPYRAFLQKYSVWLTDFHVFASKKKVKIHYLLTIDGS